MEIYVEKQQCTKTYNTRKQGVNALDTVSTKQEMQDYYSR